MLRLRQGLNLQTGEKPVHLLDQGYPVLDAAEPGIEREWSA